MISNSDLEKAWFLYKTENKRKRPFLPIVIWIFYITFVPGILKSSIMETKDKTDYAAAYKQYCTYGRGRSIKQFCEDENYNYTKFRRYIDKALWCASKSERDSFGKQFAPVKVEGTPEESSPALISQDPVAEGDSPSISISSIEVRLSNGLHLSVEAPSFDSLVDVLRKLVSWYGVL